ncbi:hypothetical protein HDU96_007623 [Phlyctochytrium bullatum]|nr:hypothetical protein HDU96_007623 [Phlyctochytrium bullatum]
MRLSHLVFTPPAGSPAGSTPLVIFHGLFGSKQNWRSLSRAFAQRIRTTVVAADLRNHGESGWDREHNYDAMSADIGELLDELGFERAHLVGHSMGGKVVMHYALKNQNRVEKLVVVDIAPIRQLLSPAFTGYELPIRQFLLTNLKQAEDGTYKFRINLSTLGDSLRTIADFPLAPHASAIPHAPSISFPHPTLFIRGSRSGYVPPIAEGPIKGLFPKSEIVSIDAGHWVHSERPDQFQAAVSKFLNTDNSTKFDISSMKTIASNIHNQHNPKHEFELGRFVPFKECPARVESILKAIADHRLGPVVQPTDHGIGPVLRIHTKTYVEGTFAAAYEAAQVALSACEALAEELKKKERGEESDKAVFALSVRHLVEVHKYDSIAILDIDYHHGNGTQEIFYKHKNPLYVSIHGNPDYPFYWGSPDEVGEGEGEGYNLNIPLPLGTRDETYLEALGKAMARIREYKPQIVVVSLGVDTFEKDVVGNFFLSGDCYFKMGTLIGEAKIPAVFIMEGGYDVPTIGNNVVNVLKGFEGAIKDK